MLVNADTEHVCHCRKFTWAELVLTIFPISLNFVVVQSLSFIHILQPHGLLLAQIHSIESAMPSYHLILCHPLLLLPSNFPASRSFPMSWLFASGDQSIGALVSESFLPVNIQGWFPLGLTGSFAHLAVQGTLKAWSRTLKDGALGQTTQKEWGRRAVAGVLRMGEHMHAHGWPMPMCQGPP